MSPDETHQEYYRQNPIGNHEKMSPETKIVIEYLKEELHEIKALVKPLPEMQATQKQILHQAKATNGRVLELEKYRYSTEQPLKNLIEDADSRKKFVREHIYKLIAIAAMGLLAGDKILNIL